MGNDSNLYWDKRREKAVITQEEWRVNNAGTELVTTMDAAGKMEAVADSDLVAYCQIEKECKEHIKDIYIAALVIVTFFCAVYISANKLGTSHAEIAIMTVGYGIPTILVFGIMLGETLRALRREYRVLRIMERTRKGLSC